VEPARLRKFECTFVHRTGLTRRISVYALDDATAERMAWCDLVGTSGWRPNWAVQSVAAEAR
jgi:transposase